MGLILLFLYEIRVSATYIDWICRFPSDCKSNVAAAVLEAVRLQISHITGNIIYPRCLYPLSECATVVRLLAPPPLSPRSPLDPEWRVGRGGYRGCVLR